MRKNDALAFGLTLFLLMGLAFSNVLDDHLAAVKKGLVKIALGEQLCKYMPAADARTLLNSWYGITITCTEPTEKMWQSYCQQFYVADGGDCGAVTTSVKKEIMGNMRVCKVIGG